MKWLKKLIGFGVYSGLLWVCSAAVGSFLNCILGGPPGTVQVGLPFLEHWEGNAFSTGLLLLSLWYIFLFFGCWMALLPPRGRFEWFVFLLVTAAASFPASLIFLNNSAWDTELADHNMSSPQPGPTAIYAILLSCVTAVCSTIICYWAVRRWLDHPMPNRVHATD